MKSHAVGAPDHHGRAELAAWEREVVKLAAPVGRAMFALIFLLSAPKHFSHQVIAYAASAGVPYAALLVPASGILALVGGLSVLLGYRARLGALLLVLFLVPVTLMMHRFWSLTDPMMIQMQMAMFMKNVAMLGGALLVLHFGAGAVSFDAVRR
ncbi:MAG: DoxX family protein [Deltaproteobacteria bacterium]|nr:DoxX family protein [Deltaproteobacteria bacterium]